MDRSGPNPVAVEVVFSLLLVAAKGNMVGSAWFGDRMDGPTRNCRQDSASDPFFAED